MKKLIISIIKKRIVLIIAIILLSFLFEYIFIIPAKIIGNIIDLMNNMENNKLLIINNIKNLVLISLGIFFVGALVIYLVNVFTRYFEKKMQDDLFSNFLKSKLIEIQNVKNGEIMSYFTSDTGNIRKFFYKLINRCSKLIAGVLITLFLMKEINAKLTITLTLPLFVTTFFIVKLRKKVEKSYKEARKELTSVSEFVQESTDSVRTTKAYSEEQSQYENFINKNRKLKETNIKFDRQATLLDITIFLCLGISYSVIILYGSNLVTKKMITIGDLVAFLEYISNLFVIIFWLPGVISSYEKAKISIKRLNNVFNFEKELKDFEKDKNDTINGDIEFKNLNFKYNDKNVLSNINLKIKQGSTLGIIGTIGSGKTTLVNLIEKLYDIDKSQIFIGGRDITDIDVKTLRNSVCYITQDNFLFSSTIKENIRLFQDEYEDEEIKLSANKAQFGDDLERMEKHIHTVIGERGIELSGGQKQRVVIARAFLDNAKIVIFDDTFSALDNKTEEKVLKNIRELTKDKTCIIISNRISDIRDADNIIVLDEGKIIQEGKHENLVTEGLYKKFYMQQASLN